MAVNRTASTIWNGPLADGSGQTTFESSGIGTYEVSWPARTEEAGGKTSPEELLAAAHASCFSMALAGQLGRASTPPEKLETSVTVTLDKTDAGLTVTDVAITVRGTVPDADEEGFATAAGNAKDGCPVSRLFAGNANITVDAKLA